MTRLMNYVYLLASKRNGTLYIGVTSNLIQRVHQHKTGKADGFTKKYSVHLLVYYEQVEDIMSAIQREKRLKALIPLICSKPQRILVLP